MDTAEYIKLNNKIEQMSSSGGANSAKKLDLTDIILTGTTNTSGGTITAGTWFYLNGKLVKAKVDIASNATFTKDTNYEEKAIGEELSKLNSKTDTIHYTANDISVISPTSVSVYSFSDFSKRSGNMFTFNFGIEVTGSAIASWQHVLTLTPIPVELGGALRILDISDPNYKRINPTPLYLNGNVIYTNDQSLPVGRYIIQGIQFGW